MSLLQFTPILRPPIEMCCYNLELQLERQLHRAPAADLVQGIEAAALAATAEVGVQHLRSLPELRRAQVVTGLPKFG